MESSRHIVFGAFFAIVGLGCIALSVWTVRRARRLRRNGISTTGVVVDHVPREDHLDRSLIRFTDEHGRDFEFTSDWPNRFVPAGDQLPVVYDPDKPQNATIRSALKRRWVYAGFAASFAVGSAFLMSGVLLTMEGISSETKIIPVAIHIPIPDYPAQVTFSFLSLALSLIPLVYSGWKIRRLFILRQAGLKTTGTVTRTIKTEDGFELQIGPFSNEGSRKPVIDFIDSRNRRIQFLGDRGPRSIGAKVAVAYLRDQPHIAVVAPPLRNATSLVSTILLGGLLTALCGFWFTTLLVGSGP